MDLDSFLTFGCFLDKHNPDLEGKFQFDIDKKKYQGIELCELTKIGKSKLLKSIENIFPKNKSHLIPLSGGLDSRAILACLLRFTEAKNIQTYTFGRPHTYDYEIGKYVAKKAGVSHTYIPLNMHRFTHDEMIKASIQNEHATHLFHHPPAGWVDKYFGDCYTWSGFMGGSLAGSGLQERPSEGMATASAWFFERYRFVHSIKRANNYFQRFTKYLDIPSQYSKELLTMDEQLNFFNRQKKYTYHHVKLCGNKMLYPYLENRWANFMLSVSNDYRLNKKGFKRTIYESFPELFKLKTKTNGGLPLYAGAPKAFIHKVKRKFRYLAGNYFPESRFAIPAWINYIQFDWYIRNDKNFNSLIYESIHDLEERHIIDQLNIQGIYEEHMKEYKNHAPLLLVLASLEYHLKSGLDPEQLSTSKA